jgi:hypothetical protein
MSVARQCYFIPVEQRDEIGFIPSLVTEGEAGHAPLSGRGRHAAAWHWGRTYDQARAFAAQENTRLGLSEADVADIVCSSMSAARRTR